MIGASWDSIGTWYYTPAGIVYDSLVEYRYNAILNQATILDFDTSYLAPNGTFGYRVYTSFKTSSGDTLRSQCSQIHPVTLSVTSFNYSFNGAIFGNATVLTHIQLFSGSGTPPASPPSVPDYQWNMDTNTFSSNFTFSNIPAGSYHVFAYDGYWTGYDDWDNALKGVSFTLDLDHDITDTVITMDFMPAIATAINNVSGRIMGAPLLSRPIVEISWYSVDLDDTLYLGNAPAGEGGVFGAYTLRNFPSLADFAYYYTVTAYAGDCFLLWFWADGNNNGKLDSGEKYYWNTSTNDYYYLLGDVTADVNAGIINLNMTQP